MAQAQDLYQAAGIQPSGPPDLYALTRGTAVSTAPDNTTNVFDDFLHSATGGLIDKADAAVQATGLLPGGVASDTTPSFGDRYHKDLTNIRAKYGDFEAVHPDQAYGAKAAGVVAPMLVMGPEAAASKTLAAAAAKSGATGAALGAAYGFGGTDDSSLGQDLAATGVGAAAGGVAGAALPVGLGIAAAPFRMGARAVTAFGKSGVDSSAGRILSGATTSAPKFEPAPLPGMDLTTGQASNDPGLLWLERSTRQATPQGAQLSADATSANNTAIRTGIGQLGNADADAGARMRDAVMAAQQPDSSATQVLNLAKSHLGGTGFYDTANALNTVRKGQSAPLYEAAMNNGPVISDRVNQFVADPILKQGIGQGLQIQRLESLAKGVPFDPKDYGITSFNEAGDPVISGVPNMRLLDAGKKGLDNIVEGYRNPITGKLALDQYGSAVNDVRANYVKALDDANPAYKAARAAWSGPSQSLDALNAGRNIFNPDSELTSQKISSLSPGDLDYHNIGVMRAIEDVANNSANGGASLNNLLAKPNVQQKLTAAFGSPEGFQQFRQRSAEILNPQTDIGKVTAMNNAGAFSLPTSGVADQFIRTGKGAPEAFQSYLNSIEVRPGQAPVTPGATARPTITQSGKTYDAAGIQAAQDAFSQKFLGTVTNAGTDQTGANLVSPAKMQKFLNDYSHVINSPLFAQPQRDLVGRIARATQMASRSATSQPPGGGSDTFQKLQGDKFIDALVGPGASKLVNIGGTLGGLALGAAHGPVEAVAGAFGGGKVADMISSLYNAPKAKVINLVTEAMHDPQLAQTLMQKASNGNAKLIAPPTRTKMLGILGAQAAQPAAQAFTAQ